MKNEDLRLIRLHLADTYDYKLTIKTYYKTKRVESARNEYRPRGVKTKQI